MKGKTKLTPIILHPVKNKFRILVDVVQKEVERRALLFFPNASPVERLKGIAGKYAISAIPNLWWRKVLLHSNWSTVPPEHETAIRWTLRPDGPQNLEAWQGPADGVIPLGQQITSWSGDSFQLHIID
jgi:hypothetical protein